MLRKVLLCDNSAAPHPVYNPGMPQQTPELPVLLRHRIGLWVAGYLPQSQRILAAARSTLNSYSETPELPGPDNRARLHQQPPTEDLRSPPLALFRRARIPQLRDPVLPGRHPSLLTFRDQRQDQPGQAEVQAVLQHSGVYHGRSLTLHCVYSIYGEYEGL